MTFIKFLFALCILVPIAVLMVYLIDKLVHEFSDVLKKDQEDREDKKKTVNNSRDQDYNSNSMQGNPAYDAYQRARMKYANSSGAYKRGYGQENQMQRDETRGKETENPGGEKRASSKRKRRKERKNKKKDREKQR